jgi:hypothetical protein
MRKKQHHRNARICAYQRAKYANLNDLRVEVTLLLATR